MGGSFKPIEEGESAPKLREGIRQGKALGSHHDNVVGRRGGWEDCGDGESLGEAPVHRAGFNRTVSDQGRGRRRVEADRRLRGSPGGGNCLGVETPTLLRGLWGRKRASCGLLAVIRRGVEDNPRGEGVEVPIVPPGLDRDLVVPVLEDAGGVAVPEQGVPHGAGNLCEG